MRARTAALATVATVGLAHVLPGLTWWAPGRLRYFPDLAGLGRSGHLALTFDDGPDPRGTPAVLDALECLGWRATFFLLGEQVAARPALAREIGERGHEIGLHGDRHRYLIGHSLADLRRELARSAGRIELATGCAPRWFRPPYGVLTTPAVVAARQLSLVPVLWSAWGKDWRADATPESVVATLASGVLDGGTALLHDSDSASAPHSWQTTVRALPLLAKELAGRGIEVGPLGHHAADRHR